MTTTYQKAVILLLLSIFYRVVQMAAPFDRKLSDQENHALAAAKLFIEEN